MKNTRNNYQGALLGLAVGDALGATTENMWIDQIKEQYGVHKNIIGGGWLRLNAGQVTDDTEMTLAVANGIIRAETIGTDVIDEIGKEFLKWIDSFPVDVGTITGSAIYQYRKCKDWKKASRLTHNYLSKKTAGNGSLMRCLPVALAYHNEPDKMEQLTDLQSNMTHYDDIASEACVIYNRIARRILSGFELHRSIRAEIRDTRYNFIISRDPSGRPSGYVVETFEWVLRILLTTNRYEDVVVRLANLGSDSDTTAAIAGGLAGLYYGLEAIPERLASKIIRKNEILNAADKLYELSGR